MEIKTTDKKYTINIDATNINDTLDGIVSALLLEGYPANVIHEGLIGKVDSMESEFNIGDQSIRVSFETGRYIIYGEDEEGLPKIKKEDVKRLEGTVVATVVMDLKDIIGDKKYQRPCFVVALDDGSFTEIDVKYCTRIDDPYIDE